MRSNLTPVITDKNQTRGALVSMGEKGTLLFGREGYKLENPRGRQYGVASM